MSSSVQRLSNITNHFYGNSTKTCANSRVPVQNLCNVSSTESQVTEERKAGQSVSDLNTVVKEKERFSHQIVEPVPNESLSQETLDLYNQLQKLVEESNGLWEKCKNVHTCYNRKYHSFVSCVDGDGKRLFEYFMYLNKTERRSKFVCQFGPSTLGTKGYIHGGATAAMMDFATALVVNRCGYRSMTANLSVDFKQPIPVDSTVLCEANIESVQGRKVYSYAEMKSHDGKQLYGTVKCLFVTAK